LKITLTKINFVNGKPLGGTFEFEILDEKYIQEQKELEFNKLAPLPASEENNIETNTQATPPVEANIPEIVPEPQLSPYQNPENRNTIILVSTALAIVVLMFLLAMLTKKKHHGL